MNLTWSLKTFEQLSREELYDILKARQEVFIVEQTCYYLDADGKDQDALHFFGKDKEAVIAYVRILAPGIAYDEPAIGRVITRKEGRGKGLGRELMLQSIYHTEKTYPDKGIRISAQSHLAKFYGDLGFVPTGKSYLEDGIPHIEMLKQAT